jgi:DNA-binding LacI/PurR family transcriptional regulator
MESLPRRSSPGSRWKSSSGAACPQVVRVRGDYTYEGGLRALDDLTRALGKVPEAVICAADVMAFGCLDAARFDRHLRIPDDISVVGFDGVAPGGWSSYRLATIRQPVPRMAEAVVALLFDCLADPERPPEKRVFSGTLIPGQSARLRPPADAAGPAGAARGARPSRAPRHRD